MAEESALRYSPDFVAWAKLATSGDDPTTEIILVGSYFEDPEVPDAVPLRELVAGKFRVYIPDYLAAKLAASAFEAFPEWTAEERSIYVHARVEELSRTPPVPWIQPNNRWPLHHGDFCRYLGEANQQRLTNEAPNGDGKAYLLAVLDPEEQQYPSDHLWDEIGANWTVAYLFECLTCSQRIAVTQSY